MSKSKIEINDFSHLEKSKYTSYCRRELEVKKGCSRVCLFSDPHIGSSFCDFDAVKRLVSYCLDENIYLLFGGDMIEAATRYSIGAGVYEQSINPNEQVITLIDFFKPLFEKGLVVSILKGNHEERFKINVGIDISNILSYIYKVPYLGPGGFNYLRVGNESYSIYYEHGRSAPKHLHTKISEVTSASVNIEGYDVFAWGHVHELMDWISIKKMVNKRNKMIEEVEKLFLITGHYLHYSGSYANDLMLTPTRLGSPILTLDSKKHQIILDYFLA